MLVLLALVALVLLAAAAKPETISVERSMLVQADAAAIFCQLNSFRRWPQWAPQDCSDPTMRRTDEGEGAISDWKGSSASGEGRMEIIQSTRDSFLEVRVIFRKPFRATNINRFTLDARGDACYVTWSMQGTNVFAMKLMSVFKSADRLLGKHFEAGLANLERAATGKSSGAPAD